MWFCRKHRNFTVRDVFVLIMVFSVGKERTITSDRVSWFSWMMATNPQVLHNNIVEAMP